MRVTGRLGRVVTLLSDWYKGLSAEVFSAARPRTFRIVTPPNKSFRNSGRDRAISTNGNVREIHAVLVELLHGVNDGATLQSETAKIGHDARICNHLCGLHAKIDGQSVTALPNSSKLE